MQTLDKRRNIESAKDAYGPRPKRQYSGNGGFIFLRHGHGSTSLHAVGEQREPNPILSFKRNVESPYRPSQEESRPKGEPLAVRVCR